MSTLIKHCRIITHKDDFLSDIFIEKETVSLIEKNLDLSADKIIDATGKYVFPGGIDPHTHFDMPYGDLTSADDFESGSKAAAFGGTTTIIDFAVQDRGCSTLDALETWHGKTAGKTAIDYAFHMIITDMDDQRLSEIRNLVDEGIPSFKLFMAYPDRLFVNDGTIYRTMKEAGTHGGLVLIHAENGIVIDEIVKTALKEGKYEPQYHALTRPTRMEAEGVHRAIAIADVAGVPVYIVHLSCNDALEEIVLGQKRGINVFAETCPQYLFLDSSLYEQGGFEGAKYVMTPALREKWNQNKLWEGIQQGQIQTIGTDHCPFCYNGEKTLGKNDFSKIPNGAPGVENRMSLMYNGGVNTGKISLNTFVEITSTSAAKIFGLYPKKGTIAVGSDADIIIFDPNRTETISINNQSTHHMNVDYNSYEGITVKGFTETVLSRGKIIVQHGKYTGSIGDGKFLKRKPCEY